jgi:signal transduction histidine kinase
MHMLKSGERVDKHPIVMKDAFGRPRNLLISIEMFESNGERCLLLMFYDITDQIKAEDRLQAINRELEIFMYKSSHNLKGPVASAKGLLQLIKKEKDPSAMSMYLELMERSITGLENTLEELMDVTRIKQGELKIEAVDLKQMLEDIGQRLQFMKEWKGINYSIIIKQEHNFYTDANLLYSIMQNLIENSVKYKHEKNGPQVLVHAEVGARQAEISVKDNGIGILPEFQKHIFEMFYRAHQESTGTGLGLYIARNAVQKLGGSIRLESTSLKGSCFYLSLPNFSLPNLLPAQEG